MLLTLDEVCERLHISKSTLYELAAKGELVFVKIGRASRVRAKDVDRFVRRLPEARLGEAA